jgi:hypothetical protein
MPCTSTPVSKACDIPVTIWSLKGFLQKILPNFAENIGLIDIDDAIEAYIEHLSQTFNQMHNECEAKSVLRKLCCGCSDCNHCTVQAPHVHLA